MSHPITNLEGFAMHVHLFAHARGMHISSHLHRALRSLYAHVPVTSMHLSSPSQPRYLHVCRVYKECVEQGGKCKGGAGHRSQLAISQHLC